MLLLSNTYPKENFNLSLHDGNANSYSKMSLSALEAGLLNTVLPSKEVSFGHRNTQRNKTLVCMNCFISIHPHRIHHIGSIRYCISYFLSLWLKYLKEARLLYHCCWCSLCILKAKHTVDKLPNPRACSSLSQIYLISISQALNITLGKCPPGPYIVITM